MNTSPIMEADLHAFVDGRLPAARQAEVQAYLDLRPEEAERLRAYTAQNAALRALFDPVLEEAVPGRLTAPKKHPWPWRRLAAGFAIALVSGGGGWLLRGPGDGEPQFAQAEAARAMPARVANGLAHQAAIAHAVYSPEVKHPVEIGADQEEQLVSWLSKRLGSTVRPPRLGKLGYELIGGRLLPGDHGAVAQFMYHDANGQRLTLYVSTDQSQNKDTGFRFAQEGAVNVFYWIDGKFGYALSAAVNKGELARVANAVYEQLQKPS